MRIVVSIAVVVVALFIGACGDDGSAGTIRTLRAFEKVADDKRTSLQEKGIDCFENMATDDGCNTWQDCVNGTCVPAPGKCVDDGDCREGQRCVGYHRCG